MNAPAALHAVSIGKSFGGVLALDDVSLSLRAGEIHALCGENGAGKSTLIRICSGELRPDRGQVRIGDHPLPAGNVYAAESAGVSVIHQEPLAFPDLSVEDSIFVGHERTRAGGLWLDRQATRRATLDLLESLGEKLDPTQTVGELSLAQRQVTAIARALSRRCRFLILDEPTACLSQREADLLLATVRRLAGRGVGILYVSHRLEELVSLAERITVLRDGRLVCTEYAADLGPDELIRRMVGRSIGSSAAAAGTQPAAGATLLEVRRLSRVGSFAGVSLDLRAGEVLGLGGLVGAGRSELARVLAGVEPSTSGTLRVAGREVNSTGVRAAIERGVVLVPEDRRTQGLVLPLPVSQNLTLALLRGLSRLGFIRSGRERSLVRGLLQLLGVKASSPGAPASSLSGGNQQKLLLAKWLAAKPRILILDEPTRGVDVGAKYEIHAHIRRLTHEGLAVLLISSDLPELLTLSDRVVVMCEGRVAGERSRKQATPEAVLALAMPPGPTAQGAGA